MVQKDWIVNISSYPLDSSIKRSTFFELIEAIIQDSVNNFVRYLYESGMVEFNRFSYFIINGFRHLLDVEGSDIEAVSELSYDTEFVAELLTHTPHVKELYHQLSSEIKEALDFNVWRFGNVVPWTFDKIEIDFQLFSPSINILVIRLIMKGI